MKSAYPYTFIPPKQILDEHNVASKTASKILSDQRTAKRETNRSVAYRQAQSSLQLDEARDDGYFLLLHSRNAVTSQGSIGFKAPTSEAERTKILMSQINTPDTASVVDAAAS